MPLVDQYQDATNTADPDVIRTIIGEAGNDPDGQRAIASVIANRAARSGAAAADVVKSPGQFEARNNADTWAKLQKIDPSSPDYQAAVSVAGPIIAGAQPPTNDYDSYYSPEGQKALGRAKPDWDDGTGVAIGGNLFFKRGVTGMSGPDAFDTLVNGKVTNPPPVAKDDAFSALLGGKPGDGPAATATTAFDKGKLIFGDTGEPVPDVQAKTYETLYKGHLLDGSADDGTLHHPMLQRRADDTFAPGTWYIDTTGKLTQVPDPQHPDTAGYVTGLGRGGLDVPNSLFKLLPDTGDSELESRLEANRLVYDASHQGNKAAQAGRFTGQVLASIPFMGGGGAAAETGGNLLLHAAPEAAPVVEFLAGKGGTNLITRAASKAIPNAVQGAGASLLTSGASDTPKGEQAATGAAVGAALGPVGNLVEAGVNKLFAPAAAGAAKGVQNMLVDRANSLPVRVPLTRGQITQAPAQQMVENAMARGASGDVAAQIMRGHAADAQAALRGNVDAIGGRLAGGTATAPGQGGAAVSDALNTRFDTAQQAVDDAYRAARGQAQSAPLPAAERGVMNQQIRQAVSDYDPASVPRVTSILDKMDNSPTSSTFTPRDIFEARAQLSNLRASNDPVEAGAAGKAVRAVDGYLDDALNRDLFSGNDQVVSAWRDAIAERRNMGKLFEGNDLIQALTQREVHGDGLTLKVSPEDASNYIFGRDGLGFVGKKDMARDLARLRDTLGADGPEWDALRSEAFGRIARAGEGAPEGGAAQFSGQKFLKAWNDINTKSPQIMQTLFSPEERKLISDFAETAQIATTPIKGGDNPSNSAIALSVLTKGFLSRLGAIGGGAVGSLGGPAGAAGGAGVGGAFDAFMRDLGNVAKARKAINYSPASTPSKVGQVGNRLLGAAAVAAPAIGANRLLTAPTPNPPPSSR